MKLLSVKNLKKVYGNKVKYVALDNINFEMENGEFVGIMGPSGSGKTTLLNMISTIDKPTSGEIKIEGENLINLKGEKLSIFRRRKLGFVFQDFNLVDTLTLGENILLPLTLDGVSYNKQKEELEKVSKILGIQKLLDKRTYEISGGQAQRTAIARALIHNPSIILADEPTGNLDSSASKNVMELLQKINREEKVTTMMVTHDAFAASYCNRILFIKDGKIYNELYKGDNREDFYNEILSVLSLIGGF